MSKELRRIDGWAAEGIGVHTMLDDTYPAQLREVLHMPQIVFTQCAAFSGLSGLTRVLITPLSPLNAHASQLASERGYTIASGGARGIDSAAHQER